MALKPWADIMPREDVTSFRRSLGSMSRPLAAGRKPAIVVVDMPRMFIDSTYPSGWSETGQPAVTANAQLLPEAWEAALPIFFTKGYPDPEH